LIGGGAACRALRRTGKQPDAPSRTEALRRLVEMALKLKRT